jgi:hypothetical protein
VTDGIEGAPRRVHPEDALRSGRRDPLALLVVWFVRKSFYWVLWVGITVGAVTTRTSDIGIDLGSPSDAWTELLSPYAGVAVALILRLGSSFVALGLAYPLARRHYGGLEPQCGVGSGIGRRLDRLQVARAYRSLRWTHHVRKAAIDRLGRTGARLRRLDPMLDVANIGLFVAACVVLSLVGAESG